MADVVRKVCMLGDFGVGKTSLVARYIANTFSDKYLTTVGVKTDTKLVQLAERRIKMVLWDIAGKDSLDTLKLTYVRGSTGLVMVADGTRAPTVLSAMQLLRQAREEIGEVAAVLLVNKFDLFEQWEVAPSQLAELRERMPVFETSALSGESVEEAFTALAERLP